MTINEGDISKLTAFCSTQQNIKLLIFQLTYEVGFSVATADFKIGKVQEE
jgi:hypothetical protein